MSKKSEVRVSTPNVQEQQRWYRVERHFSEVRCGLDMVKDLLRAHSGT